MTGEPTSHDDSGIALLVNPEDLPIVLQLVLPATLKHSETLKTLATAIQTVTTDMAQRAATFRQANREAGQTGNLARQAITRAHAEAYASVARHLSEKITGDLALFDQDAAFDGLVELPALQARHLTRPEDQQPRPQLPQADQATLRQVMAAVLSQRDGIRVTAAKFLSIAADDNLENRLMRLDFYSQAKAYANLADQLDLTLTHAYGADEAYQAYLDQHGTCLEHIVILHDLAGIEVACGHDHEQDPSNRPHEAAPAQAHAGDQKNNRDFDDQPEDADVQRLLTAALDAEATTHRQRQNPSRIAADLAAITDHDLPDGHDHEQ